MSADDIASYLQQTQLAGVFRELLDQAIAALVAGDRPAFQQLLSPSLVQAAGPRRVDAVIGEQLLPFFHDYTGLSDQTTITNATDTYGNEGLAFYSALRTRDGRERPFVIYIVEEAGRPVVANLLVDTTYADMHGGHAPEDVG